VASQLVASQVLVVLIFIELVSYGTISFVTVRKIVQYWPHSEIVEHNPQFQIYLRSCLAT
jgi:hypothetical protein